MQLTLNGRYNVEIKICEPVFPGKSPLHRMWKETWLVISLNQQAQLSETLLCFFPPNLSELLNVQLVSDYSF